MISKLRNVVLLLFIVCTTGCKTNRATNEKIDVKYYDSMSIYYHLNGEQESNANIKALYQNDELKSIITKLDSLEIIDSVIYSNEQAFYVVSSPMSYAKKPRTAYLIKTVSGNVLVQYWLFQEKKILELFCVDSLTTLDTIYRRFPEGEHKYRTVVDFIDKSQSGINVQMDKRTHLVISRDSTMLSIWEYTDTNERLYPTGFPLRYFPNEYSDEYFTLINL